MYFKKLLDPTNKILLTFIGKKTKKSIFTVLKGDDRHKLKF